MGMEADYNWDQRNNFNEKELKMIEFKKASKYNFEIEHTDNGGCILRIGCCIASFSNPEEMLEALAEYYKDPEETEKRYNNSMWFEERNGPNPAANRYFEKKECCEHSECCEDKNPIEHSGNN